MIEKEIIMLIGLPGSGKSTWTNDWLMITESSDIFIQYEVIGTDKLIDEWAAEKGITYSEAFKALSDKSDNSPSLKTFEKQMFARFEECMEQGISVIIDRTNMSTKSRQKFLSKVPADYNKLAIVFEIEEEELKKRLKKRQEETGKGIPAFVIANMRNAYEAPTSDEFDSIRYVNNNDLNMWEIA